ncbi:MAG: hypothetical protein V3T88_07180 [Nitrosomonadaceae bacterium]
MASVDTLQFESDVPNFGTGIGGSLKVLIGAIEIASALSTSDTINLFTMPAGFTPLFGRMVGDDIDTGTETLEIDIGISGDATKYLNSGVITGDTIANEKITVGISIPLQEELMTVRPTELTVDTDLIATITAAANAGGTGTLTVWLCGVMDSPRIL